ncbi:hypothetical protein PIB30_058965 [Stylosanthes scabra]|uniref:Dirigent protein n=1 Tax=Stylosanthes scabra TaxID=79078 RepID=A0ABU6SK69_9FABA|nr:hypothetical protein [Stylosanthes scabra]
MKGNNLLPLSCCSCFQHGQYLGNIDKELLSNLEKLNNVIGKAQGFYHYDRKDTFTAWLGFSFVFNSTYHKGTINFVGAVPILNKTRDISVIGGTGDFFMHRGIATISMDAFEGAVYFRLLVDINFYECW